MNQVEKHLISDDKLERSVYFPDVANMEGIDVLGSKNKTQTSYLKDDLEVFFSWLSRYFWFRFERIFWKFCAWRKKSIDYKLPLREILTRSKKTFSFLENHGYLYDFLATVLENTSLNNIRSLQVNFLNDWWMDLIFTKK